jgi:RNA polymerase sigma-70 factor (ECF subfamily)
VKEIPEPWIDEDKSLHELLPLLDRELERLPAKYRAAVVLCYLEGKTRKAAAHQLGLPVGTLSGRLTTAMRLLAKRLSRHGLALSGGTLAALLSPRMASASVSPSLIGSAVQNATLAMAGQAAATGAVSANVTALAKGVMKAMLLAKLKTFLAVLMAVALPATGAGLYAGRTPGVLQKQGAQRKQPLAAAPGIERSRPDEEKLQGSWVAVSGEEDGQKLSRRMLQAWGQLDFAGSRVTRRGGERRDGSYKLDPDKLPKEIDLFTELNTWTGIYRFEGSALKLVLRFGERRPTDFDSREALLLVFAHKRETDPGADSQ